MLTIGKSKNGRVISTSREAFERCVQRGPGCWLWGGYRNEDGYGVVRVGGRGAKLTLAHRLSWTLHCGEIPEGLHVLHSCDTPSCVRPDHLFLGSNLDNIRDRQAKGRSGGGCFQSGDASPTVRWTEAEILQMRKKRAQGQRVKDIAAEYGIQRDYLSRILNGHDRKNG